MALRDTFARLECARKKEDDPLPVLQSSKVLAALALIVFARHRAGPARAHDTGCGRQRDAPAVRGRSARDRLARAGVRADGRGWRHAARADAAVQLRVLCADGRRRIGVRHAGAAREVQWVMDERVASHGGPDRGWRDPEAR